jgi:hypothetical protein
MLTATVTELPRHWTINGWIDDCSLAPDILAVKIEQEVQLEKWRDGILSMNEYLTER